MKALYFLLGLAVGAGASYVVCKNKFEDRVNEELLKDIPKRSEEAKKEQPEVKATPATEAPVKKEAPLRSKVVVKDTEPYEISELEFEENAEEFEQKSLIYYISSDVLTEFHRNEDPEEIVVTDVHSLIGDFDCLAEFQNCENDFLYVRNEALRTDFEIMASAKVWKKTKKAAEVVEKVEDAEE